MYRHTMEQQHNLWLLAAAAAPIAHFCGCGWLAAGLTALLILPLNLLPGSWSGMPKAAAVLEIGWFGLMAGTLLKNSALYWPSDNRLAVPLILLALAACTKPSSAPRVGAVLALCMALLAVPLAAAAAGKIQAEWLRPEFIRWPAGLAAALLVPALPAAGRSGGGKRTVGTGALTIALAVMVQGTVSLRAAASLQDPFYQTARTLGHLEPVAAAAMTLGWYALAVCLFHSAHICAEKSGIGNKRATVLLWGTAAVFVLYPEQLKDTFLMVLSVFFWVLIPFFNKMKKVKKVLDKRTNR